VGFVSVGRWYPQRSASRPPVTDAEMALLSCRAALRVNFPTRKIIMRHIHIYGVTFIVANHNKQRERSISFAFHQTVRAEFLRDLHYQINTTLSNPDERYCGHDPPRA
jgi:hypothetical protein